MIRFIGISLSRIWLLLVGLKVALVVPAELWSQVYIKARASCVDRPRGRYTADGTVT
jgi:hypothetical protein